jgi:hypothetical protein
MKVFPLPYVFDVDKDTTYSTTTVVFQSQKKQVQRGAIAALNTWRIQCKGDEIQLKTLEAFHDSVGGNADPFLFYNEDGVQIAARFAEPKLSKKLFREFTLDNPTHGNVVGFTANITIESVI